MNIRLMNDYTVELPLWVDDGLMDENALALAAELEAGLRAWAANFNQGFTVDGGWPSAQVELAHRAEAERLLTELQRALPEHTITLAYWENRHA